jgi:energy-coupling factor transporter ATP-binding protein EcfA2
LPITCLAGTLSFNLASPESTDDTPVFTQLMLDEAFSKSDPQFAQQALQAFRKFGFQLVIVATVQNATTIQPYIDSVVMVSKTKPTGRNARPLASVATRTISEFTTLRHDMRAKEERVPAGVRRRCRAPHLMFRDRHGRVECALHHARVAGIYSQATPSPSLSRPDR